MKRPTRRHCVFLLVLLTPLLVHFGDGSSAAAQMSRRFKPSCVGKHSIRELEKSIRAHNEHTYRMERKYSAMYYFTGKVPEAAIRRGQLEDAAKFLEDLERWPTGIIFYARRGEKLCSWLVWRPRDASGVAGLLGAEPIGETGLAAIQVVTSLADRQVRSSLDRLIDALRDPNPRSIPANVLAEVSPVLVPDAIAAVLIQHRIERLVVVPVTVGMGPQDDLPLATVPFPALRVGSRDLVDLMSVVIAPGFYAFTGRPAAFEMRPPIPACVIADPMGDLAGARQESEMLDNIVLASSECKDFSNKNELQDILDGNTSFELIHLATHAYADSLNPLDQSYVELGIDQWTAREISHLALPGRPLVVMSACETGRGRNFGVGTIGLARSWQWAGASNVVMSLWRVDDAATRDLMVDFVRRVSMLPPDIALQRAMKRARRENPNPALWAGFTVFGAPMR